MYGRLEGESGNWSWFKCDLCDVGYVGFTRCHLHQGVQEHRNSTSAIGKHFHDKHSLAPRDLTKNFRGLNKCTNKFEYLIYEFFLFKNCDLYNSYIRTYIHRDILRKWLKFCRNVVKNYFAAKMCHNTLTFSSV